MEKSREHHESDKHNNHQIIELENEVQKLICENKELKIALKLSQANLLLAELEKSNLNAFDEESSVVT
jgi:hypothetical protein